MKWRWDWRRSQQEETVISAAGEAMARARRDLAEVRRRQVEVERLALELRRALGAR
jgi:hypothetical protein